MRVISRTRNGVITGFLPPQQQQQLEIRQAGRSGDFRRLELVDQDDVSQSGAERNIDTWTADVDGLSQALVIAHGA